MEKEQIEHILKKNNLKATTERISVLKVLINTDSPLTAEDIYIQVQTCVDQSTVYRTVNTFAENNIVYQTNFRDNKTYYEFQKIHHHHITCTTCGNQEHITVCLPTTLEQEILQVSKTFSAPLDHTLEFFGECNTCKQ